MEASVQIGPFEVRNRFRREVQAQVGLTHPGVVQLFECGEPGGAAEAFGHAFDSSSSFVAMELAAQSVRELVLVGAWPEVRRVLEELLGALAQTHARGVISHVCTAADPLVQPPPRSRGPYYLAHFCGSIWRS